MCLGLWVLLILCREDEVYQSFLGQQKLVLCGFAWLWVSSEYKYGLKTLDSELYSPGYVSLWSAKVRCKVKFALSGSLFSFYRKSLTLLEVGALNGLGHSVHGN